jgi:hypothetical protein
MKTLKVIRNTVVTEQNLVNYTQNGHIVELPMFFLSPLVYIEIQKIIPIAYDVMPVYVRSQSFGLYQVFVPVKGKEYAYHVFECHIVDEPEVDIEKLLDAKFEELLP